MRYQRQEHIVATICDEEVNNADDIKELLEKIKELKISFSLTFQKSFPNSYTSRTMFYDKVKLKNVHDDKADFKVFLTESILHLTVAFDDIDNVLAVTEKSKMLKSNPDLNRFGLMDIEIETE